MAANLRLTGKTVAPFFNPLNPSHRRRSRTHPIRRRRSNLNLNKRMIQEMSV